MTVQANYLDSGLNSEGQLTLLPKYWKGDGTERAVIFAHGYLGDATECWNPAPDNNNLQKLLRAVVDAGFAVVSCFNGGNLWGSATHNARLGSAYSYLTTTLGAKSDSVGLIGQSMGHLAAMNWAAQNRAKTRFVVSSIGVCNLSSLNSQSVYTSSITTAYGKAYTDAEFGAVSNPTVNAATKFAGLPWLGWHGTADTVVLPSTAQTLAAAIGSSATLNMMSGAAHDWPSLAQINADATVAWMLARG